MPSAAKHRKPADTREAVDRFMAGLEHPHKAGIEALRRLVTALDPAVAEGIKWNAPSFRTADEYFATTHLRGRAGIGLILHLGAKARELPAGGLEIDDPAGLLQWLGKDRALVEFADLDALERHSPALQSLLRQWMRHV